MIFSKIADNDKISIRAGTPFTLSITIERSPADVFAFLRDKDLYPLGMLILLNPVIRLILAYRLRKRLEDIKLVLESGWEAP